METPFRMAYKIFICVGVAFVGVPGFVTFLVFRFSAFVGCVVFVSCSEE